MSVNFHSKKTLMLTNKIVLAISGCDTLRPLVVQCRSSANTVCNTKYPKTDVVSSYVPHIHSTQILFTSLQLVEAKSPLVEKITRF